MILNEQVIFVVGIMLIITIDFLYIGIRRYIEKNEKYSLNKCDPLVYSSSVIIILHELFYTFYYWNNNKKLKCYLHYIF